MIAHIAAHFFTGVFHHLLLSMGLSHRDTVLFIYAITFLFGTMALLITLLPTMYSILASCVALLLIFAGALKLGILNKEEKKENE